MASVPGSSSMDMSLSFIQPGLVLHRGHSIDQHCLAMDTIPNVEYFSFGRDNLYLGLPPQPARNDHLMERGVMSFVMLYS